MIDWRRRRLTKANRVAADDAASQPAADASGGVAANDRNHHVKEYLRYYLSFSTPPGFAVLLNGPWGIGKTYVVKNFLKSLDRQKTRYIYVSLYGLGSLDEIDDAILQSMYPVLKKKGVTLGGRALKMVGKYFNVELDLESKDFVDRSKSDLYVFDDLERCQMPINTVMGYINVFVEQEGRKVVIIANESEIADENYQRIREKVVGRMFDVQSAFDDAQAAFIASVKDDGARGAVAANASVISEIYHQSELDNLRILQQAIWDFERFYAVLDDRHRSHDKALTALLGLLFAISFEVKAGRLSAGDMQDRQNNLLSAYLPREEGDPVPEILAVEKRYPTVQLDTTALSDDTLIDLIVKGVVDPKRIRDELDQSSYFVTVAQEPAWRTVWHSHERTEEEVDRALAEMERAFAAHEYTIPGEVLHVFGLRLWLSRIGGIANGVEQVVADGRAYVDYLYANGLLEPLDRHEDHFGLAFDAYDGLGFHESRSEEYIGLRDYLDEKRRAVDIDRRPAIAEELLANMQEDSGLFLRRVSLTNQGDNEFYDIPVLASLDPARFVDAFLGLEPRGQRNAMIALKARYKHGRIDEDLSDERPWAVEVRDRIRAAAEGMSAISKDRLQRLLIHGLDEVLGVAPQGGDDGG